MVTEQVENMEKLPSAFKLFKPSVAAVKRSLAAALLFIALPSVGSNMIPYSNSTNTMSASKFHFPIYFILIGIAYVLLLTPITYYLEVNGAKKLVSPMEALKGGSRFIFKILGLNILLGLLVLFGLVLFIVPGLFLIKRYCLAPYVMVGEGLGITDSFKRSHELTKGHGMAIWGVFGVTGLISLLIIIPFIGIWLADLGMLLYAFAFAIRYNQLKSLK